MGGTEYLAQPNIEYKNWSTIKIILKTATSLSWFQPMFIWDYQHSDGEHIIETGNGNHTDFVIDLYIAIDVYILLSVTYVFIVLSNILPLC